MNKTEFALEDFKNIQELIRFVDQKAGATLIIYIFISTSFIDISKDLVFINPLELVNFKSILFSCLTFLFGSIVVVLLFYQVYYILFEVIQPKRAKHYCEIDTCLFYFEHIANLEKLEFVKRLKDTDSGELLDEITSQIYEVAQILNKKNRKFCIVLYYLFSSLVALFLFIFFSNLI